MSMSKIAIPESIESLSQKIERLQSRLENLEDLNDLEAAIIDNAGQPLLPWEQVKLEIQGASHSTGPLAPL